MTQAVSFSKLHGQGNDFIVIDDTCNQNHISQKEIAHMCHRRLGIGADGLIMVRKSESADFQMLYYNADGSVAEMCGNGIRCMARFLYEKGIFVHKTIAIETLAGIKKITMRTAGGKVQTIKVNMGKPAFEPSMIPADIKGLDAVFGYKLTLGKDTYSIHLVSMGNPHCVIFHHTALDEINLETLGPALEQHPLFPQKTNVEFVRVVSKDLIEMRVWERGVGETLSCGTGACACAVAAIKLGKIPQNTVKVRVPGGMVDVLWDDQGWVYLEGPVQFVFDGQYCNK